MATLITEEAPPPLGRRFGSLHASLVARHLDSRTAVRLLRLTAKRCSSTGPLRLWTFDCYSPNQANELASKVDRNAVRVVRVHWSLDATTSIGRDIKYFWNDYERPTFYNVYTPEQYFRHCEAICLVGFPRYLKYGFVQVTVGTSIGLSSIDFYPKGDTLTLRNGVAAVFAIAPKAPQSVTRRFRLRVNDVSRTFTSTFNNGRHGSSNFCHIDEDDSSSDDDDEERVVRAPVDVRLDWLPDLPASQFRVETRGDDRASFIFDRSLARGLAVEDAIMSPGIVFGSLSLLVFPTGRTEASRGRVGVFLRLMVYNQQDVHRSRHFDIAVNGRRVGTVSNSFGMDQELVGLDDVGASDELFPRRGDDADQIVVEVTERPATQPGWICGTCDAMTDGIYDTCASCDAPRRFTITRAFYIFKLYHKNHNLPSSLGPALPVHPHVCDLERRGERLLVDPVLPGPLPAHRQVQQQIEGPVEGPVPRVRAEHAVHHFFIHEHLERIFAPYQGVHVELRIVHNCSGRRVRLVAVVGRRRVHACEDGAPRLPADVLHDVDLAARRPAAVRVLGGQHPDGRPEPAVVAREFGADLDPPVQPVSSILCP